jgi:hypothetical protein
MGYAPAGPESLRQGDHKGSRKRVRRIRLRENTPRAVVLLGIVALIIVIVTVVWAVQHPEVHRH